MKYTFAPGPSQLYPRVEQYLIDAFHNGILSGSHRSRQFQDTYAWIVELVKLRMKVPNNYTVLFFSSATECWQVLAQGAAGGNSLHVYSGDFGERWFKNAAKLASGVKGVRISPDDTVLELTAARYTDAKFIALTQNETSNGSQVRPEHLLEVRNQAPNAFIAIDATSSMAGIELPWHLADFWFASVQKCFGLPAGLGIMFVSPEGRKHVESIGYKANYNALESVLSNADKHQTVCTPNVLGIYLLYRALQEMPEVEDIHRKTVATAKAWYQYFEGFETLKPYVHNPETRSDTVFCIETRTENVAFLKQFMAKRDITIGSGYGQLKEETFRIANFPAIPNEGFELLHAEFELARKELW
jgi:phosphoserine aminotransferase